MQKPDIIGAFKVAAQRNQGLDAVKRSLIAAGYDAQDVEDSALAFSQGQVRPAAKPLPSQASAAPAQPAKSLWQRLLPAKTPAITAPLATPTAKTLTAPEISAAPEQQEKKEMPKYLIIAIISSVVVVLGLLGYVVYKIIAG